MTKHDWLVEYEHILEHLEILEQSICKSADARKWHQVAYDFKRAKFHVEKSIKIVSKWSTQSHDD